MLAYTGSDPGETQGRRVRAFLVCVGFTSDKMSYSKQCQLGQEVLLETQCLPIGHSFEAFAGATAATGPETPGNGRSTETAGGQAPTIPSASSHGWLHHKKQLRFRSTSTLKQQAWRDAAQLSCSARSAGSARPHTVVVT